MSNPVFISYSRTDLELAVPLLDWLRSVGLDPWLDQTSIPVSVPWFDEITKAVRQAELVLVVDSPAWRGSANCQKEFQLARELGKEVVILDSDAPDDWQERIRHRYEQLSGAEMMRAQLLGDSFRWQSAGRQRHHLPTGRLLRVYRALALERRGLDGLALDFVLQGRRAANRVRLRRGLAALLTWLLYLGFDVGRDLQDELEAHDEERAAELAVTSAVMSGLARDPYPALREIIATARERGSSWATAEAVRLGLETNLPFSIDNPADSRPRPAAPLPDGAQISQGSTAATYDAATHAVRVSDTAGLTTIRARGAVTALAVSVDGDRLAVADSGGVSVIRLPQGTTITVLRGLDGAVDSLRWADASTVEATAGAITARWRLEGEPLALTGSWYMDLAASPDRSRVLAVGREGSYTLIVGRDVEAPQPLPGVAHAYEVTWANERWVVGGVDENGAGTLSMVGLDGTLERSWPVEDCTPMSIVPGEDATVVFPCRDSTLRTFDLDTGRSRAIVLPFWMDTVARREDGSILAVAPGMSILRVPESGEPEWVNTGVSVCATGTTTLVPSHDDGSFFMGGQGYYGCATLLRDPAASLATSRIFAVGDRELAYVRTATWSSDDSVLVTGWASGDLWFFDTALYSTRLITSPTGSEIRGAAFNPDETEVMVVTRDGEVLSLSTELAFASFEDRVAILEQRLQVGIEGRLL